ncbi:hypothetical protein B9T19_09290 [Ignatzschineria sp. F8392]|uniref:hypothetical protein n=1 Tax=Ignatzschineria sp. F8392 TaxID=1980117 RepID=UPI000B992E20|nr:hypothetical protein [Ignatzschineria sp. F8392]OYQ77959.1 hypothetical protein B9T19_09290 [Ignatzschineria sp. F8392]
MGLNHQLEQLYRAHLGSLSTAIIERKINCTSPLLIQVDESRWQADTFKVMIFGQEVRGWKLDSYQAVEQQLANGGIERYLEELLAAYSRYFYHKESQKARSRSIFMKAFSRIKKVLKQQPSLQGRKIHLLWNNINKIARDKRRSGMTQTLRDLEAQHFLIAEQEIEILKPDLILFLTGPSRVRDIKSHFKGVEVKRKGLSNPKKKRPRNMWYAQLQHPILGRSLILYHPRYYAGFTNHYLKETLSELLS